jgi:Putative serine esterase (DUF676)
MAAIQPSASAATNADVITPAAAAAAATVPQPSDSPGSVCNHPEQHLFVLVHGFQGAATDLSYIASQLHARHESLCILVVQSNDGFLKTYDGIDSGGTRIADEVQHYLSTHTQKKITQISFIGHSLGGLFSRYAIGVLQVRGLFKTVTPQYYVSLASPHIGSRQHMSAAKGLAGFIVKSFSKTVLGVTGRQLMLLDEGKHRQEPLLDGEILSNDELKSLPILVRLSRAPFVNALRRFRTRRVYANVKNDISVHFCTSGLFRRNPYKTLAAIPQLEKYKSIVDFDTLKRDHPELLESFPELHECRALRTDGRMACNEQKYDHHISKPEEFSDSEDDDVNSQDSNDIPPAAAAAASASDSASDSASAAADGNDQKSANAGTAAVDATQILCDVRRSRMYVAEIYDNLRSLTYDHVHIVGRTLLAHTDVAVRSEWMNSGGKAIVQHLLDHIILGDEP